MYLSPMTAIENKWIKFPKYVPEGVEYDRYIQPNAIDITVDKVLVMNTAEGTEHAIHEDSKRMPEWKEPKTGARTVDVIFETGKIYDVMSDFYVEVPQGVCASLIIRSSFSRCGVRLSSGLYDSGFKGNIGFSIINHGPDFRTAYGTRIAQIAFIASDSAKHYAGGYNTQEGKHWADARIPV